MSYELAWLIGGGGSETNSYSTIEIVVPLVLVLTCDVYWVPHTLQVEIETHTYIHKRRVAKYLSAVRTEMRETPIQQTSIDYVNTCWCLDCSQCVCSCVVSY